MQAIAPLNILTAMFVLQIVVALTMLLGVAMDRSRFSASRSPAIYIGLFFSFILSLLVIVFTDEFYQVWHPMIGDLSVPTLRGFRGKMFAFGINYVTVFLLVASTGSRNSPLMPVLFLLPTVSIFLRDPPPVTLIYGFLSGVYYFLLSFRIGGGLPRCMVPSEPFPSSMVNEGVEGYNAHRIVMLLCLAITLLIGYITRPAPVL